MLPVRAAGQSAVQEYTVPAGSHPHDVAPAADGGIWFTAQAAGYLGWLDPNTGETRRIPLGQHSAPHGVIVGPDDAAWVTDGGQNAIVRVDGATSAVQVFPLPDGTRNADLNTATFDRNGTLWFTGQAGLYGHLDPSSGAMQVWDAPRGPGAYGMTATPDHSRVFFASLASSYIAEINLETGEATPIDPPTARQGARRIWSDSHGALWVSEWDAGQLARYDPVAGTWQEWKLPGARPQAYAVYVDEQDAVWLSNWDRDQSIVRFDPASETFTSVPLPRADVREIQGRAGEIWAAESALDRIVVIRH
ncbi:MAG: SMP-30/gluconolactonase/LRE family protein [Chloroflexi bacterium]|nr:SMP-30/gluconolactonase/LRE family protein [Chloroflexota bacterium]MBV9547980.1 SMP-30/gluconolactonase/LRE family protein [Chloroflexota bacterium]